MKDLESLKALALEAKARAEKASPGPWSYGTIQKIRERFGTAPDADEQLVSDIYFSAEARTDVPALAEAVLELIERIKKYHFDVSTIRRATDDIAKLKDINRMAREALKEKK